jgi:UDP:flavonoid glycosyltransferase YjiC (YdhE family)
MNTVLLAWQLGAGCGHLSQMTPLVRDLKVKQHRVVAAVRNLPAAAKAFAGFEVKLLQAPAKTDGRLFCSRGITIAHLLANVGFGDKFELFGLSSAWQNLIRLVRPDLIIFDHSPTALLAARGLPVRKVLIGSGFCCPYDVYPMPFIRSKRDAADEAEAIRDEDEILGRMNRLLGHWRQPPLERLGQLYGEVDEVFLTTFPELDHYQDRPPTRYWGPVNATGGNAPEWPDAEGKRVYSYLKPFPTLADLLQILNEKKYPMLIYPDGIKRKIQQQYQSDTLRFVNERLNMAEVGQQCDLAILNAGHGTTCDILLAGKPIMPVPLQAEQQLMAENVSRLGAGATVSARQKDRARMESVLDDLLTNPSYTEAAQRFAQRYSSFNPKVQQAQMLQRVLELLEQPVSTSIANCKSQTTALA